MQKAVILAMSCNKDIFLQLEKAIKNTYASDIFDNKFKNISFWLYTASYDNKYHINKKQHKLYVPCDDSLHGTFDKTQKAIKLLNTIEDYDYIIRTNCSTYININVLNIFLNHYTNPDKIYSGNIYASYEGSAPYYYSLYGTGNSLILSKKWIDLIVNTNINNLKSQNFTNNTNVYTIDDNAIGFIINSYLINHQKNICDYWQSFNMPQFNNNFLPLNVYMFIPVRAYDQENRQIEIEYMNNLHNTIISEYKTPDIIEISKLLDEPVIYFMKGQKQIKMNRYKAIKWLQYNSNIPYIK